ncbi:MAG TPA: hypothetical protein DCX01_02860 [Bacteroidetes bacterium]|nr:hypothetical protein [Bacteroidota bacterium]
MKSILVPTDFSDTASNAADYAAAFCKEHGLQMYVMHAMHVPLVDANAPITLAETMMDNERKFTQIKLDKLAEELTEKYGINIKTESDFGLGSDVIIETAETLNAEAIVMGTSGESGLLASLLGSVTAAVAKRSDVPVIAVPKNAKYRAFKNVVFGNDNKEPIAKELATIHEFFKGSKTKLHIVSVQGRKGDYVQEVICDEGGVKEVAVWDSSVEEGLTEYLDKENADILAIKQHTRGFIEELFHKSTTKELLKDCSIPLFIF